MSEERCLHCDINEVVREHMEGDDAINAVSGRIGIRRNSAGSIKPSMTSIVLALPISGSVLPHVTTVYTACFAPLQRFDRTAIAPGSTSRSSTGWRRGYPPSIIDIIDEIKQRPILSAFLPTIAIAGRVYDCKIRRDNQALDRAAGESPRSSGWDGALT
jgi:hypothetical protein